MYKLSLTISICLLMFFGGCNKLKKVVPSKDADVENLENFQPTEQGKDYISESGPRSFVPAEDEGRDEKRRIKDGTYIADVEYFNTATGANVTYVTKVMVKDGYLEVIKWPNGVWIASQYFSPQKIKSDGTCLVKNIEAGYENRVRILNLEYY